MPYYDNITIVGADESGLQLAIGLRTNGYCIRLASHRRREQIAAGRIVSRQCVFATALSPEIRLRTNSIPCPPRPDALELHTATAEYHGIVRRFANRADDPSGLFSYFMDAELGPKCLIGLPPYD